MNSLTFGIIVAALSATAARADLVTLQVWALDEPTHYTETLSREFEAKNPDVKVDIKIVNFGDLVNDAVRAVATKTAPDVTMIDNPETAVFSSRDLLLDLTPYVQASKVIHRDDFYPGPLANMSWDGHILAISRGSNTVALYYNADMFKAAGLDPDKPPKTWQDLYDAAKKLTDPAKSRYGLAFSAIATEESTFQFLPFAQTAGGNYDALNAPGSIRALQFWRKLLDEKLASHDVLIWRQNDATGSFIAQNAAMSISGPWELPALQKDAKFDWRVALLPVEKEGSPRVSALGEFNYAAFKSTKHPAEAFRLFEYFVSQAGRNWNEFGMLPSVQNAASKDPKWPAAYAVFTEQMKYARARGPSPVWPLISKAIQTAIQATLTDQTDAKTALETAQKTVDKVLKK